MNHKKINYKECVESPKRPALRWMLSDRLKLETCSSVPERQEMMASQDGNHSERDERFRDTKKENQVIQESGQEASVKKPS